MTVHTSHDESHVQWRMMIVINRLTSWKLLWAVPEVFVDQMKLNKFVFSPIPHI